MKAKHCIAVAACATALTAQADCFWSRIDREPSYSDSGAWNPSTYRTVSNALTVANLAGALWEGTDSRLGRTMWESAESQVLAEAVVLPAKRIFGRVRPVEGHDPCLWGKGGNARSFPSEEAAVAAALVTPYVLEYGRANPAVYGFLLLPAYVGAGRVKNQAHWQSDVVAGWAVGAAFGSWEHGRDRPLVFALLPGGAFVGLNKRF
jgi:membrane-associated phospholipid phosphatase